MTKYNPYWDSRLNSNTASNYYSKINNIKLYVLPGHIRYCKPEYWFLYEKTYDFWQKFMKAEMQSENIEDIESKLSSDSYMLFEDIYVLTNNIDNNEQNIEENINIVGMFCFDTKDVSSKAILAQSSFKVYPKEILDTYVKPNNINNIMTIGHLLVHPEWRRSKIGIGLSDILVWFMHKRFIDSNADLMLYPTRDNRSTNNLGTKHGGRVVLQTEYGGMSASIIVTDPKDVILDTGEPIIDKLSQTLWNNKILGIKEISYPSYNNYYSYLCSIDNNFEDSFKQKLKN